MQGSPSTAPMSGGVVHDLPADLRQWLAADEAALARWEDLTPLARNEWICWIESVKRPETRRAHVERTGAHLKEGKRRPCCWPGCPHRPDRPPRAYARKARNSDREAGR